MVSVHLVVDSE